MSSTLPPAVEDLRRRTRAFIRETVVPREPFPGERMSQETREELQALAKQPMYGSNECPASVRCRYLDHG
ncbi:hypothetical protein JCM10369A_30590 [Nocardioides pyridinolyticus]